MQSVEWPDTSQLFDEAEFVMKNPVDRGGFFPHTFVCERNGTLFTTITIKNIPEPQ